MKRVKNNNTNNNAPKSLITSSSNSRMMTNEQIPSINLKDKMDVVLGEKIKELQNILKMKKDQNNQLLNQIQNLSEKTNELVSKRNKLLVSINQQKSRIFILKNKNRAYRNYLNELTSKDSNEMAKNKKEEDVFNSISTLSENISNNINYINGVLKENSDKLKLNQNDLLQNIPVDFLKKLGKKNDINI